MLYFNKHTFGQLQDRWTSAFGLTSRVQSVAVSRLSNGIWRRSGMSTAKRLVLSLRGRKQSSPGGVLPCDPGSSSSSTRLVIGGGGSRYGGAQCSSPAGGDHHHTSFCSNHELDEIAVVSTNADPLHVKYGSGSLTAANGPRLVPGTYFLHK